MTTLAQMLIERGPADENWGPRGIIAHGLLQARLKGVALSDQIPLAPSLTLASGAELKHKAEQFIFTEDAPAVVRDLILSGAIDGNVVFQTARVPTEVCWIEWKTAMDDEGSVMRIGALLDGSLRAKEPSENGNLDGRACCIIAAAIEGRTFSAGPAFFASVDRDLVEFNGRPGVGSTLHWSISEARGGKYDDGRNEYISLMQHVMFTLFLIVTPRVCEVVNVDQPARLQMARKKRGKPPLLEYKHMVLKVGQGATRHRHTGGSSPSGASGVHHRLHQVIGHFRTYREGRETPHVSWVPPHWRGDAELGIVLHTREVRNVREGASHVAVE